MSKNSPSLTDNFDPAVIMAYQLLSEHVSAGNAETASLAKALEDLTEVLKKHELPTDSLHEPQPHK